MATLIDAIRAHIRACCHKAGEPVPQFSDAQVMAALVLEGFDPSEPRDESGKWTSGGGGGMKSATHSQEVMSEAGKMFHAFAQTSTAKGAHTLASNLHAAISEPAGTRKEKAQQVKQIIPQHIAQLKTNLAVVAEAAAGELSAKFAPRVRAAAQRFAVYLGRKTQEKALEYLHSSAYERGNRRQASLALGVTGNQLLDAYQEALGDVPGLAYDRNDRPRKEVLDVLDKHFLGHVRSPILRQVQSHSPEFLKQGYPPAYSIGNALLHPELQESRRATRENFDPSEPRDDSGKWTKGDSGGKKSAAPPKPHVKPKYVARLARFTSEANRRKVRHGLRNEAELAHALGAHNLPDSEPADVIYHVGPSGEITSDPRDLKQVLHNREYAVGILRNQKKESPERIADAQRVLAEPLVMFEVKTLHTQQGEGRIKMSAAAVKRKQRWEKRYGAKFQTVAFDDRRGKKHSGNRLYYKNGVGSSKIADMEKVADFNALLDRATT